MFFFLQVQVFIVILFIIYFFACPDKELIQGKINPRHHRHTFFFFFFRAGGGMTSSAVLFCQAYAGKSHKWYHGVVGRTIAAVRHFLFLRACVSIAPNF